MSLPTGGLAGGLEPGGLAGGLPVPGASGNLARGSFGKIKANIKADVSNIQMDKRKIGELAGTIVAISVIMTASHFFTNNAGHDLISIFLIMFALFFGFAPYIYRCFIFYRYLEFCLPRWGYAIISIVLWVFALFLYNKVPN